MYLITIINFYYLYFNVLLIEKILNMFSCFVKSVSTLFALVSTLASGAFRVQAQRPEIPRPMAALNVESNMAT